MSLTTSAKYVRFVLSSSRYAIIADFIIVFGVMMGVLLSNIPLVASLVLLSLCVVQLICSEILIKPLYGAIVFGIKQELHTENKKYKVKKIFFSARSIALIVVCDGDKLILWRDSITERDYRRLICFLRGSYD